MDRLTGILRDRDVEIRATKISVSEGPKMKLPFLEIMDNILVHRKIPYAEWIRKKGKTDWQEMHERRPELMTGISWLECCKWISPFIYQAKEELSQFVSDAAGVGYYKPYRDTLGHSTILVNDDSHVNEVLRLTDDLKDSSGGQETLIGPVRGWHQPSSSYQ